MRFTPTSRVHRSQQPLATRTFWAATTVALLAYPLAIAQAQTLAANSGQGFVQQPFAFQTSQFTATFQATPSSASANAVVGFSDGSQQSLAALATQVRFNANGFIDAINGDKYTAATKVPYAAGMMYTVRLDVDVVNHVYNATVTVAKGQMITIGTGLAFATAEANVFALNTIDAVAQGNGSLNTFNLAVTANAPQIPNPDCTLIVPNNVLSAAGLSTPFQLTATDPAHGPCHEANDDAQSAFVQAAIIDTTTGQISIYNPVIVDQGTAPAVAPVVPALPKNNVVALWTGFQGNNLTLQGATATTLANANCVNGSAGTVFGQFSYCNAVNFFAAANKAIANKQLVIPALAGAKDGQLCPTTHDFFVIDQDPSDNLTTQYLVTPAGQIAQYSAANLAKFPTATAIKNASDERLLAIALDTALGCTPLKAPDLTNPGTMTAALALNELMAAADQAAPVALVSSLDPMTLVNAEPNLTKENLYRAGVGQPQLQTADNPIAYCDNLATIQPPRLLLNQAILSAAASPVAAAANSLFTFMAQRFVASYGLLNCANLLNKPSPVAVTFDGNGVAISATITPFDSAVTGFCTVTYAVTNQWINGDPDAVPPPPGAFQGLITIQNTGAKPINNWTLQYNYADGQTMTQSWNGNFTQNGSAISIANASYNATIAPGDTVSPGFLSNFNGVKNSHPTVFRLNGVTCN